MPGPPGQNGISIQGPPGPQVGAYTQPMLACHLKLTTSVMCEIENDIQTF